MALSTVAAMNVVDPRLATTALGARGAGAGRWTCRSASAAHRGQVTGDRPAGATSAASRRGRGRRSAIATLPTANIEDLCGPSAAAVPTIAVDRTADAASTTCPAGRNHVCRHIATRTAGTAGDPGAAGTTRAAFDVEDLGRAAITAAPSESIRGIPGSARPTCTAGGGERPGNHAAGSTYAACAGPAAPALAAVAAFDVKDLGKTAWSAEST